MLPTEAQEQQALVKWLTLKKIFHFAPINENQHSSLNKKFAIQNEAKAKSMGKLTGTSDLIIMLPTKILFIELKRQRKRLKDGSYSKTLPKTSDAQKAFLEKTSTYPYARSVVAYGWKEAMNYIEAVQREESLKG